MKHIVIKDTTINGNQYSIARYLSNHNYFNSDKFKKISDVCARSVENVIERDKELLEKIVEEYRIGRYTLNNVHALRLLIYGDAHITSSINRLQTDGKNQYAALIKKEIASVIHDDYMQLPDYMRAAMSEADIVNALVSDFLRENNKEIRKAVSDTVYGQLRKIIDNELL